MDKGGGYDDQFYSENTTSKEEEEEEGKEKYIICPYSTRNWIWLRMYSLFYSVRLFECLDIFKIVRDRVLPR